MENDSKGLEEWRMIAKDGKWRMIAKDGGSGE